MTHRWSGSFRRLLRVPRREDAVQREIDDELRFHVETRLEALIAAGLSRAAAEAQVRREFGDVERARSELQRIDSASMRRSRLAGWRDAIGQDLRYAFRGLRRSPGFAITVVLTLAIGIGANATMFGIVDRLMLRAAPHVQQAEELRRVYYESTFPGVGLVTSDTRSYPDFVDLRDHTGAVFAGVAARFGNELSLGRGPEAVPVRVMTATASLFPLLGVQPFAGRFFTEAEDQPPSGQLVVVLGHRFWQRRFGGDASAVGRSIDLQGRSFVVIGIAPPGFRGIDVGSFDLFIPLSAAGGVLLGNDWQTSRRWRWLQPFVRLAPGVTEAQAAEAATLAFRRASEGERVGQPGRVRLASVLPGRAPNQPLAYRVSVWLLGVTMVVLAIATANVMNLMLTRAARRRREVAVRLSLGVSQARLLGQLVTEALVLAMLGSAAALLLARFGGAVLRTVLLPDFPPEDAIVDGRVLLVSAVIALCAGLATGVVPAFWNRQVDPALDLRSGARDGGYRRSRLRGGLLVAQASLSVLLLAGAALFVRSFIHVLALDLGYDADRVLVGNIDLSSTAWSAERKGQFWDDARERVSRLPEVETVSLAVSTPFWSALATELRVDGHDSLPPLREGGPYINAVGHEYFATMGMRLTRGRGFEPEDVAGAPWVAVVNETMERLLWPGASALGKCLYIGDGPPACSRVVGVVHDARMDRLQEEDVAQYYVPIVQNQWRAPALRSLAIRPRGEPEVVARVVARTMQSLSPDLPFADVRSLQSLVAPQQRPWRLGAVLFLVFGGLALVVAAVGLYSVVSYDTAQRTHELGVRAALGARRQALVRLVVRDGLTYAGLGAALGLALALALGRRVESLLFEVSPRDPLLLGAAVLVMLLVALIASAIPAARATQADPARALRSE
ncbi:MAG TPA: ADOP family duplicated permease [Gemmatimonadaceae bacterium]|nr:ADOP family duplicated permease [Gemmatimonadaceae bacterium]